MRDKLRRQALALLDEAKSIREGAISEGRALSEDEASAVDEKVNQVKGIQTQIDAIGAEAELVKAFGDGEVVESKPEAGTAGERFIKSETFQSWFKSVAPGGSVPSGAVLNSPPMLAGGFKDILTVTATGLVTPDNRGAVDAFSRPLNLRDLLASGTTASDTISHVVVTMTNHAAVVAEAQGAQPYVAGAGQVEGLKPESPLTFTAKSENVKTIAHMAYVTEQALSDAGQLQATIDNAMRFGLEDKLEAEIINGNGTTGLTGLLNVSGSSVQAYDTSILKTTRKALTTLTSVGGVATAYLVSPADNEKFDLETDTQGRYQFGGPASLGVQTLWGVPRIVSSAVPEGTAILADLRQVTLWDRQRATIAIRDTHADLFARNMAAVRAELRAAVTVDYPSRIVEIDLTA